MLIDYLSMLFVLSSWQRNGAEEAHWAHNPRVGGSKLPSAMQPLFFALTIRYILGSHILLSHWEQIYALKINPRKTTLPKNRSKNLFYVDFTFPWKFWLNRTTPKKAIHGNLISTENHDPQINRTHTYFWSEISIELHLLAKVDLRLEPTVIKN